MAETAIRIRKTRPLTVLLSEILSTPIPIELQRLLSGRRTDGSRKKGRPRSGTIHGLAPNATYADALILALLAKALSGDTQAMKLIMIFVEGLPTKGISFAKTPEYDSSGILDRLNALFKQQREPDVMTGSIPENGDDPAHL